MTKNNNKNRKYTGLVHTPSSMSWLINKRRITQGLIDRLEKQLLENPMKIKELELELDALGRVILLHEVAVNPAEIEGKQPKAKAILPRGAITRGIFEALRNAAGSPITSLEIVIAIAKKADIEISRSSKLPTAVKYRLKNMYGEGKILRHHDSITNDYGKWSLAPEYFED